MNPQNSNTNAGANDNGERKQRMRSAIMGALVETGETSNLRDLTRSWLVEEGWHNKLKEHCLYIINQKGVENIGVDELIQEVSPMAREMVPDRLRDQLVQNVREFLEKNQNLMQ
ncbi:hypothetical protein PCE1_001914 [Barthelona sp. PCE]